MDFKLPQAVQDFRNEVRDFVAKEWPRDRSRAYFSDDYEKERVFRKKLSEKGWLTISWPREYGGSGRSILEQYVFCEDMAYYGAPYAATGVYQVGPTVMVYGSEEQKQEFLPRIAAGEIDFCLGYTEPQAGTDLASLQLRAVADGDDFILNGTKIFTSGAHRSEYAWLAARTDPDAPKHRGISLFMVPMDSPGITVVPLWTMSGLRTNQTFWDNVRVPRKNMVGEENRGWYYVAHALDLERISIFNISTCLRMWEDLVEALREAGQGLRNPPLSRPDVRLKLADFRVQIEAGQGISLRVAWMISRGDHPNYEASMLKIFGTELMQRLCNEGTKMLGPYGQLMPESLRAPINGRLPVGHLSAVMPTFGAGANEVMRNIIATRGLGLPRG